jgi:protein SCO1/2
MRLRLLLVVLAGFLIGAIGGAAVLLTKGATAPPVETTGKALIGGHFALIDQTGKPITDRDFRGRYLLVFFGFTHCPDICPTELQVMAAALEALSPQKRKEIVPVFITLDPERDTPEVMAAYVKNFGQGFVGLTGSAESISAAAKAYRIAYSKFQQDKTTDDYTIDHSSLVYLIDKNGDYITHFAYGIPAAKITETLRRYL